MSALPANFDELRSLLIELTDGELTADQRERLRGLIANDDRAAEFYAQYMSLHAGLLFEPGEVAMGEPRARRIEIIEEPANVARGSYRLPITLAGAAAVLIAGAAVAAYLLSTDPGSDDLAPAAGSGSGPPIALLLEATGAVVINDGIANEGQQYAAGRYTIESGSAEFQFTNGTTVQLLGRSALTFHHTMAASLTRGEALFHCPPDAVGYTVDLPDGRRVVDLGTDFHVHVNDSGETEVRVFDGAVVVDDDGLRTGMIAGQAVAIADDGVRAIDDVLAVARAAHDPVDTPEPVGAVSEFAGNPERYALAHLFDNQITGEGADYAGDGPGPHAFVLDLGVRTEVRGVRYAHRHDSGDWRVDRVARVELTFADDADFTHRDTADVVVTTDLDRRDVQTFVFAMRTARYVRVRLVGAENTQNPGASLLHLLGEPKTEG